MYKILIADDENRIREVIKEYGKLENYEVDEANDGYQVLDMVKKQNYDCIVLDIMMPNLNGYSTCKALKEAYDIPIIMLSARVEEEDKLYGFSLGIDDYVAKPFSPKELMARIKVAIERRKGNSSKTVYKVSGIQVDNQAHNVTIDNEIVHLTNKEYDLLLYFISNPNIAISREVLISKIWGYDTFSGDRTVDTHIKMLRKSLKQYGNKIITIRGVGYKFEKD